MKTKQLVLILAIAIAAIFNSCKKGDPGPAGATGATGTTGAAGPTGATGTANVIYSPWFQFALTDWADSAMGGIIPCKRAIKTETKIIQDIIDKGLVLGYLKNLDFGGPFTLPFTSSNSSNVTAITALLPSVGKLIFYNSYSNNGGGFAWGNTSFRYVIIPGGVLTPLAGTGANGSTEKIADINGKLYTESQLKAMPYSQVCSLLKIAE